MGGTSLLVGQFCCVGGGTHPTNKGSKRCASFKGGRLSVERKPWDYWGVLGLSLSGVLELHIVTSSIKEKEDRLGVKSSVANKH